jgi:hypothetical protein
MKLNATIKLRYVQRYLRIFERGILRIIFGPMQNEDGFWRIRMNYELNKLIVNADRQ